MNNKQEFKYHLIDIINNYIESSEQLTYANLAFIDKVADNLIEVIYQESNKDFYDFCGSEIFFHSFVRTGFDTYLQNGFSSPVTEALETVLNKLKLSYRKDLGEFITQVKNLRNLE